MSCEPNDFTLVGAISICNDTSFTTLGDIKTLIHPLAPFHTTTLTALANTFAQPADHANLLGFGVPGVLFTGPGSDRATEPSKYISIHNLKQVLGWLEDLKPAAALSLQLCGCDVGAEAAGSTLLTTLANELGIPVSAPSGFVFIDFDCNRLYLQPQAKWVTARPGTSAQVVPLPAPPDNSPTDSIILFTPTPSKIPARDVLSVRLGDSWRGPQPPLSGTAIPIALPSLHLNEPFVAGPTLAVLTGSLSIDVAGIGRRKFNILNGRMLQDAEIPSVYYQANLASLELALQSTAVAPGD